MMRHKGRKNQWPIAASFLAHSLFIGLVLGLAAIGTRLVLPDAMMVTIVSSTTGDSEDTRAVQKTVSRPRVAVEPNKVKPEKFEEEKADDAQIPVELTEQTDRIESTNEVDVVPTPSDGSGQTETAGMVGAGSGPSGAELVSTGSKDALAGFLLQVRQTIQRHKQYPRRARSQGIEGTTQLRFRILPTGEPAEIQVMQSSQSAILDEEAVATVKRVERFPQPPVKSPLGILIRLPLVFHLEEGG